MRFDHHGARLDNDEPADDFTVGDFGASINRCLDHDGCYHVHVLQPGDYHIRPAYVDALNARFIAALDADQPDDGWHAADELAYAHDRATHLGRRPG